MKITHNNRGFPSLHHDVYVPKGDDDTRILTASSAIGDYGDSLDKPGSSFLWVGLTWHLNREQVAEMIRYMQGWLETGRLEE